MFVGKMNGDQAGKRNRNRGKHNNDITTEKKL